MNKFFKVLVPAAALLVMAGCAKENTNTTGEKARQYLELAMQAEYPGLTPDQWGIYVLEETPGLGVEWNQELSYTYMRSTIRTIAGTILSSTEEDIAKQLDQDSYKPYNYYGPRYVNTASGSGYAGLEYMLQGMRYGGSKTAVIPSWLLTTSRYGTKEEYLNACDNSTHLVYTVTLEGQCKDVEEQEIVLLSQYVEDIFGADQKSCSYTSGMTEGTFYFVSDTTAFKDKEQRADDAKLKVNYTGRRLDGVAFDTNVLETAIEEGLYTKDRTYGPADVTYSSSYSSITMGGSSSLIDGFKGGLYKMHWVGQKATVLFVSALGYSSTGSGDAIPPYSPLIFELELVNE